MSREFGGAGSDEGGEGIDAGVDAGGLQNIGCVVESKNVDDSGGKMNDNGNDANKIHISKVARALLSIQNKLQNKENATGGKEGAMVALANLTADGALEHSSSLSELNESVSTDPIAKAFLTDDIRVTLMTFWVLGEEKVCVEDVPGGRTSILPVVMVEESWWGRRHLN